MPVALENRPSLKKIKVNHDVEGSPHRNNVATTKAKDDLQADIFLLEQKILESRKNYNDILSLLKHLHHAAPDGENNMAAAVALCRVFCQLLVSGSMTKVRSSSENDLTVIEWLHSRLDEYHSVLVEWLNLEDSSLQNTAMTLLMRLVREEAKHLDLGEDFVWSEGIFARLIQTLVTNVTSRSLQEAFFEGFVNKYDDVRFYLFSQIADLMSGDVQESNVENCLHTLAAIDPLAEEMDYEAKYFVFRHPKSKKQQQSGTCSSQMKQAQRAWMTLLQQKLSKGQRKHILEILPTRIVPWLQKTELLMDFLTDSFDLGGSTSLTALSGLFYLTQHKNLDYPQFYQKLYSLLNEDVLHSKHRSRFFRLLETFLASTHLPAGLVASFIKRLSRLCLYAPPSGIVAVVPWIYNLLQNHPTCTYMIHRTTELQGKVEQDWGDPFRMDEPDPMETGALESSLWEIETLQSHYHPNVATIAKIISEQFTKHVYNLEDFLDHSYGTMLDAELSKDLKKPPEIEFEIPKKILTKWESDAGHDNSLLVRLWDFA